MMSSLSRQAALGAILLLLAGRTAAQKPADPTAVLIRIEGQVTLSPDSRAELRAVRRAAQRQVIRRGETVHVPAGAQATLVCSTETLVDLQGPLEWVLDAAACGRGLRLPESTYRYVAPQAGRLLPRRGVLLLEFETRGDENRGPVLLSPRDTAVLEPRPLLVWTQVAGAVEYEIEIRGTARTLIRVEAGDLQCGQGSGSWHDLDVCSWRPSGRWPGLEPGTPVLLRIGDRRTVAAARDSATIHLLPAQEQETVRETLRQIATLPLDEGSRLLLKAGGYARHGLYSDAIATYDEALRDQDVPAARVTLGDLYLDRGLTTLARREYRKALAGVPDPAAQAAAELGLGYVAYLRKRFAEAEAHFEHARKAYAALGLPAEAEEAQAASASAHGQAGNSSP